MFVLDHLTFRALISSYGGRSLPLLLAHLNPPSRFVSADLPGGAVQGVGQSREHTGGTSRCRSAGEELSDVEGSGCEDAVPAEMAGHRRQRPQRDQELRKDTPPSVWLVHVCSLCVALMLKFIWWVNS